MQRRIDRIILNFYFSICYSDNKIIKKNFKFSEMVDCHLFFKEMNEKTNT